MSRESLGEKQQRLSAEISRQRGELTVAYRDIAKPILYVEYGMRGFGFLRQNPWVLTVVPAVVSITTSAVNLVRNRPAKSTTRGFNGFKRAAERETEREAKSMGSRLLKWGGHGWKIYRLYHRARKFLS